MRHQLHVTTRCHNTTRVRPPTPTRPDTRTGVARCADPDKLDLDFTYHLQVPLNVLPEDAALFFELRHWKAAKTKVRACVCVCMRCCTEHGTCGSLTGVISSAVSTRTLCACGDWRVMTGSHTLLTALCWSLPQWSVKCYTFLPYSQCLRAGAAMLELYKKPAAYKQRGRPASYTSKPMYLHLACSLEQH
jgi:hypothetical protein